MTAPDATCPDVTVVVVTWNARAEIATLLGSLPLAAVRTSYEVVVVDNGSTDDTVAAVRTACPTAIVIANTTNRGLAAANNQGFSRATGRHVLVTNPDVVLGDGAVDALVAAIDRHPRAAAVVPSVRHPDGNRQTSAGDLPTLREALLGRALARRRSSPEAPMHGLWWDAWAHDEERPIGRGHECCWLLRRRAIEHVGPQDERYRLDWEGFDWTDRARRAGWEVWFTPTAEVVHVGGSAVRRVPYRWIVSSHRGMYRYFADRRPAAVRPLLAIAFAARAALKAIAHGAGAVGYDAGAGR